MIPEMSARSRESPPSAAKPAVRIWSAACSTGEEPYSIAMTLLDAQRRRCWPALASALSVVASDLDTTVLAKAASGIYTEDEIDGIDFLRGTDAMTGCVKVKKHLAALVEFHQINLMDRAWPLSGSFDAIFFRKALIYFRQETQDLFLRRMMRYLRPGGYLFLGHSEHIPWLHSVLEPLQQTVYALRSAQS
jgi:chemotaxis protein methyltransferase CheR